MAAPVNVNFDFDGAGAATGAVPVSQFDWAPGNSVIIANPANPASFTVLFQANLGFADVVGGPDVNNGAFGSYFTAVAGFQVLVDFVAPLPNGGSFTNFLFDPASSTNFFKIYQDSTPGDDLAGTGFTDGNLILSGTALPEAFSSSFTVTDGDGDSNNDTVNDRLLDGTTDGNQYPGVYSILGTGATALKIKIDSFDPLYFTNLLVGQSFSFTNTSQIDPYNTVNPSQAFSSNGIANGDACGVPCVGAVNGRYLLDGDPKSDRTVAQSDANSSFDITPVPEPGSLFLMGVGILGLGAIARRRQNAKQ